MNKPALFLLLASVCLAADPVPAGTNVTLVATAEGTTPMEAAWTKDGAPIGTTSPNLQLPAVTKNDEALYRVKLSNSLGSAFGEVQLLVAGTTTPPTVVAPTFTVRPENTLVELGKELRLVAEVAGTTPALQWSKDGVNLAGATTAVYIVPAVSTTHVGSYVLTASNSAGTVTAEALVGVFLPPAGLPPKILVAPASLSISRKMGTAKFFVVAEGPDLKYQWKDGTTNISGATSSILVLNISVMKPNSTRKITVTVSNPYGTSAPLSATLAIKP